MPERNGGGAPRPVQPGAPLSSYNSYSARQDAVTHGNGAMPVDASDAVGDVR
jgi:hypothetical protein